MKSASANTSQWFAISIPLPHAFKLRLGSDIFWFYGLCDSKVPLSGASSKHGSTSDELRLQGLQTSRNPCFLGAGYRMNRISAFRASSTSRFLFAMKSTNRSSAWCCRNWKVLWPIFTSIRVKEIRSTSTGWSTSLRANLDWIM